MADTLLMTTGTPKDVIWVSSSLDDLQRFPDPVKKLMGFALSRPNAAGSIFRRSR
jgi:phage-related protein